MKKDDYIKFCLLYKGENSIVDNTLSKNDDEFKWFMWNTEFVAVHEAIKQNVKKEDFEEFFKQQIRNGIETYAGTAFGGDARDYFDRYFKF